MQHPVHSGPDPLAIPHHVSDLILAHAIRLAADQCQVTTAYRHDEDGFPEPTDGDDDLIDLVRTYLLVAPDLPIAQQAAIHHHPDIDLVELCAVGELVLVKAWFAAMNRTHAKVLDSTIMHCLTAASENGHVHVLDWIHRYSRRRLFYSTKAMDLASAAGEVGVLQWWLDSGLKLRYTAHAVDGASGNGETEILEWWKSSGLEPLEYTEDAVDLASADGRVDSLQWWLDSGLEIMVSGHALHEATAAGCIEVLQWWKGSGLELKYDPNRVMFLCTNYGRVDCFEWWTTESGLIDCASVVTPDFAFTMANCALDEYWAGLQWRKDHGLQLTDNMFNNVTAMAAKEGRLDVLSWWVEFDHEYRKRRGPVLRHAAAAGQLEVIVRMIGDLNDEDRLAADCKEVVDAASSHGHVHILEWWQTQSGPLDLAYTALAIDGACEHGHLDSLKWWAASGLECRFTGNCVDSAARLGHVAILEWLHNQPSRAPISFPNDYSVYAIDSASSRGYVEVLQLFLDSGRELRYSESAMNSASSFGLTYVLDWWLRHQDRLELKYHAQAAIPPRVSVHVLEWWKRSGFHVSLDRTFGGPIPFDSQMARAINWSVANGYKVTVAPYWLSAVVFELVESFVDVVGIKVTAELVEQLREQGQEEHILEWLETRIVDGDEV